MGFGPPQAENFSPNWDVIIGIWPIFCDSLKDFGKNGILGSPNWDVTIGIWPAAGGKISPNWDVIIGIWPAAGGKFSPNWDVIIGIWQNPHPN